MFSGKTQSKCIKGVSIQYNIALFYNTTQMTRPKKELTIPYQLDLLVTKDSDLIIQQHGSTQW